MNKELSLKILKKIDSISDKVKMIYAADFTEDRQPYMVVVGITDKNQIYSTLPDYEYRMTIVIDTFIVDDDNGVIAQEILKAINKRINPYIYKEIELPELFEELPVVGFLFDGMSHTITAESNRYELNYLIYTSETM